MLGDKHNEVLRKQLDELFYPVEQNENEPNTPTVGQAQLFQ